ncbi:hypothetical protein PIB30_051285 [Stylosanthes scabra]|uniref:Uncharacterized protein n=1 Tax=Stylosanthes scabra TaxID=79078 RepID=A0ABU6WJU4_9FABA|nr:hypothetical protein [Stylosanthes scabra]
MEHSRSWMYDRVYANRGGLKPSFITGLDCFLQYCMTLDDYTEFEKIRCPFGLGGYNASNDDPGMKSWDDNVLRYESMVADAFPQFDPIEEDSEGEEHHDLNPERNPEHKDDPDYV